MRSGTAILIGRWSCGGRCPPHPRTPPSHGTTRPPTPPQTRTSSAPAAPRDCLLPPRDVIAALGSRAELRDYLVWSQGAKETPQGIRFEGRDLIHTVEPDFLSRDFVWDVLVSVQPHDGICY